MNLRNEKGAITLLVVSTGLFFIVAIVCVQAYLQGKLSAVNEDYKQIKSNYEADLENIDDIYNKLTALDHVDIDFKNPEIAIINKKDGTPVVTIKETFDLIIDSENVKINTLKFGWMDNDNMQITNDSELDSSKIKDWQYVEIGELVPKTDENGLKKLYYNVVANKVENKEGYYYLCVKINESKEIWLKNSAHIKIN